MTKKIYNVYSFEEIAQVLLAENLKLDQEQIKDLLKKDDKTNKEIVVLSEKYAEELERITAKLEKNRAEQSSKGKPKAIDREKFKNDKRSNNKGGVGPV